MMSYASRTDAGIRLATELAYVMPDAPGPPGLTNIEPRREPLAFTRLTMSVNVSPFGFAWSTGILTFAHSSLIDAANLLVHTPHVGAFTVATGSDGTGTRGSPVDRAVVDGEAALSDRIEQLDRRAAATNTDNTTGERFIRPVLPQVDGQADNRSQSGVGDGFDKWGQPESHERAPAQCWQVDASTGSGAATAR